MCTCIYTVQRMVGFGKLPKYHQDPTTEELAKTLDCWPSITSRVVDM